MKIKESLLYFVNCFKHRHIYKINGKKISVSFIVNPGKEGVVELRRNKKSVSIGNISYAQGCIFTDNRHYIKGMMIYNKRRFPISDVVVYCYNENAAKRGPKEILDMKSFTSRKELNSVVYILTAPGDWDNWATKVAHFIATPYTFEIQKIKREGHL